MEALTETIDEKLRAYVTEHRHEQRGRSARSEGQWLLCDDPALIEGVRVESLERHARLCVLVEDGVLDG